MRKLFMFIAITALAIFGLSCGSDEIPGDRRLELGSDVITAKVGSTITFTVNYRKALITDAVIIGTNDAVVENFKFTPIKPGEYSFTTKKKGFNESNVVKIIVTEGEALQYFFVYSETPKSEIKVDERLSLKVVNELGEAVEGAQMYIGGGLTEGAITDNNGVLTSPVFKKPVNFTLHFEKDGIKSNPLKINVLPQDAVKYIKYNGKKYKLDFAVLSYEASDAYGAPRKDKLKGSDDDYFMWEIEAKGDFGKTGYNNILRVKFASKAILGSDGKPVLTKDSKLIYLDSYCVVKKAEFLSLGKVSQEGEIKFEEINFDNRAVYFTISSPDIDIEVDFNHVFGNIYSKYTYQKPVK